MNKIITALRTPPYTLEKTDAVARQILGDRELTPTEKCIAWAIMLHLNRAEGYARPGLEAIAKLACSTKTKVIEAYVHFEDRGHFIVEHGSKGLGGRGKANRYFPCLWENGPGQQTVSGAGNGLVEQTLSEPDALHETDATLHRPEPETVFSAFEKGLLADVLEPLNRTSTKRTPAAAEGAFSKKDDVDVGESLPKAETSIAEPMEVVQQRTDNVLSFASQGKAESGKEIFRSLVNEPEPLVDDATIRRALADVWTITASPLTVPALRQHLRHMYRMLGHAPNPLTDIVETKWTRKEGWQPSVILNTAVHVLARESRKGRRVRKLEYLEDAIRQEHTGPLPTMPAQILRRNAVHQ